MEKTGWKITAFVFIVLTFILGMIYLGFTMISIEHSECKAICESDELCLSYQYDMDEGTCEIIDSDTIEQVFDEYMIEQGIR